MNGQTLVEQVRETKRTELDRLGSEKALLAATNADLSTGTVLETVALRLDGLRGVVEGWVGDATADTAREAFAGAAADIEAEYERVRAELDADPAGEPAAAIDALPDRADPVERVAGGFVGHGLVLDGLLLQVVSFFVNEADRPRADMVRDLRSAANSRVDEGATLLDGLCADEDDWTRARTAATDVVEAAYREYVERLDGMGIDPKPVC